MNNLSSNVNLSLSQALNGQTLSVGVVDPTTGTLVNQASACNISANTFTVTNNAGISLGGGVVSGLGGTSNTAATAGDLSAIALGNGASTATGALNAIAIGPTASATATNGIAIGGGASATAANSVALGANSIASIGGTSGYSAFGLTTPQTSVGEVSVGSAGALRQITNLAAGLNDTDAVNVAQLRGTATSLGNSITNILGGSSTYNSTTNTYSNPTYVINGNNYSTIGGAITEINNLVGNLPVQYSTSGAPTTPNPGVVSNDITLVGAGGSGGVFLHNVGAGQIGLGSTDAINGSQLYAVNQNLVTILGGNTTYNPTTNTFTGPTYTIRGNTYTTIGNTFTAINNALNSGGIPYIAADTNAGTAGAIATGTGSTALGYNTTATGAASTVVGNGATDNGNANATVLGANASVTAGLAGANVALGQGSVASTGALSGYDAFGLRTTQNSVGEVSVGSATGDRQVTNVAAGLADTDAVNVGQLRGTASNLGVSIANTLGGGSTYNSVTGAVTSPNYVIRGNTYNTVGGALTALDDVVGTGSPYLSADATAGTVAAVSSGAGSTTLGYNASATGAASTVVGNGALDNGVANSTVLGSGASITAGLAGSNVALGQGSVASTGALSGYSAFGIVSPQTSVGEVSVGSAAGARQITNVAAGLANTDAVNVAQLRGTASTIGTAVTNIFGGGSSYDSTTGAITSPTYTVAGTSYTTVSSALNALSQTVGQESIYFTANSTLGGASATGTDTVAIGPLAVASGTGSVAIGNGASATGIGSIAIGAGSTDGGQDNVVSVGAVGAERRITNVAAGTVSSDSTDAVNGSQLYALSLEINNPGAANTGQTTTTTTTGGGATTTPTSNNGTDPVTINDSGTSNTDPSAVHYDTNNGVKSNVITLAGGSPGAVRISNVADGIVASDAVNLGQLQASNSATLSQANAYTDQQVGNLAALTQKQIKQARADAAGGTALALAATGVRYDDRPGKFSIGGATSYYHDQMGIAFGIGSTSEDGRYRFNASITASPTMTNPDVGAVVGASVSLN